MGKVGGGRGTGGAQSHREDTCQRALMRSRILVILEVPTERQGNSLLSQTPLSKSLPLFEPLFPRLDHQPRNVDREDRCVRAAGKVLGREWALGGRGCFPSFGG